MRVGIGVGDMVDIGTDTLVGTAAVATCVGLALPPDSAESQTAGYTTTTGDGAAAGRPGCATFPIRPHRCCIYIPRRYDTDTVPPS